MANLKSSVKRARQAKKRRSHNRAKKSAVKTVVKKTMVAIEASDKEAATGLFSKAQAAIAKLAKSSALNKKRAARHTSRLAKRIGKIA